MRKIQIITQVEEGADFPIYACNDASGADVRAHIQKEVIINARESKLIPIGLRFEIPKGYEIQVRPRSGLALKYGITVLNSPGTIDADYRGEVSVILINHGEVSFTVTPRMRIAQLVVSPVYYAQFCEKKSLGNTTRGEGGFGHTGTH